MAEAAPVTSVDALLQLVADRVWHLEGNEEPGAEHARDCDFEWMISVQEWGARLDGLLTIRRESPEAAFEDALGFRNDALACGFQEAFKCVISAARISDQDDALLGWHGRINLGLIPSR
jgi:hypothetical protein